MSLIITRTTPMSHHPSPFSNVPLDAAFAAIIGVIVVAIGLAVRVCLANEDREVFDVR